MYGTNTQLAGRDLPAIEGEGSVRFSLAPLQLMRGNYFLSLAIHSWDHKEQFHRREDWWPFAVRNDTGEPGLFRLRTAWDVPPATDRTPPPP